VRERGLARATASAVLLLVAGACLDAPPSDTRSPGSPDARVEGGDPDGSADGASISLEDGLVAWYLMDQMIAGGGGATAPDETGGDDGACTDPACPQLTSGHIDNAYMFDGSEDEILVPDRAALHTESGTVAVWVYLTATGTMIVGKPFGSEKENSWLLYAQPNGSVLSENTAGRFFTDPEMIDLVEWTHLAMTWSPDRSALYIDGALAIEEGTGTAFDSNPVVLGADHDYGGQILPLHGLLDDVRIYDRALNEAEIAALAAM